MRIVKKITMSGIDYLPDISETPLIEEWERAECDTHHPQEIKLVAQLYMAIARRENYFQDNVPTAFGNPEYSRLEGFVDGFIQGARFTLEEDEQYFIIKKGKKKVLLVEKITPNPSYYMKLQEISDTWDAILG